MEIPHVFFSERNDNSMQAMYWKTRSKRREYKRVLGRKQKTTFLKEK